MNPGVAPKVNTMNYKKKSAILWRNPTQIAAHLILLSRTQSSSITPTKY
jgi:hypothetical protein